jgi:hypothetical protein
MRVVRVNFVASPDSACSNWYFRHCLHRREIMPQRPRAPRAQQTRAQLLRKDQTTAAATATTAAAARTSWVPNHSRPQSVQDLSNSCRRGLGRAVAVLSVRAHAQCAPVQDSPVFESFHQWQYKSARSARARVRQRAKGWERSRYLTVCHYSQVATKPPSER